MSALSETKKTFSNAAELVYAPPTLPQWLEAFYNAKCAEGKAGGMLAFYRKKLSPFLDFCHAQRQRR